MSASASRRPLSTSTKQRVAHERVGALAQLREDLLLGGVRERGIEEGAGEVAALGHGGADRSQVARDLAQAARRDRGLRQRGAVDASPGCQRHALLRPELREVDLGRGPLRRAAGPRPRRARGPTTFSVASSVRSATWFLIWSIDWRVSAAIAALAAAMSRSRCAVASSRIWRSSSAPVRACALDDLARLAARLGELLLVLVEQHLRLVARALGGLEVLAHDRAALLDHLRERTERVSAQDPEAIRKKMTSVQIIRPGNGLDEIAGVVLGGGGRDDERSDHLPMKNATNDMSRA